MLLCFRCFIMFNNLSFHGFNNKGKYVSAFDVYLAFIVQGIDCLSAPLGDRLPVCPTLSLQFDLVCVMNPMSMTVIKGDERKFEDMDSQKRGKENLKKEREREKTKWEMKWRLLGLPACLVNVVEAVDQRHDVCGRWQGAEDACVDTCMTRVVD